MGRSCAPDAQGLGLGVSVLLFLWFDRFGVEGFVSHVF